MSKNDKSISEKMNQLRDMVAWFRSEEFELEDAVEKFEQANTLALEIEKDLTTLQNEVVVLQQKFDK